MGTIISLVVAFSIFFISGCSLGKQTKAKTFRTGEMSVVLTDEFVETSLAGTRLTLRSNDTIFVVSSESRENFEDACLDFDSTSKEDYVEMVKQNNNFTSVIYYEEDLYSFGYWKNVSGQRFYYKSYVFKTVDDFWLCQFGCLDSDISAKNKFLPWARTITFTCEFAPDTSPAPVTPTYTYSIEGLEDTYILNEEMDLTDAYVLIECSDQNILDERIAITEDMITGFNSATKGNKTLTVNYEDEEIDFDYTVLDLEGLKLEVYEYRTSTTSAFTPYPATTKVLYEMSKDMTIISRTYYNGSNIYSARATFDISENGDINVYTKSGNTTIKETLVKSYKQYTGGTTITIYTSKGTSNGQYIEAHLKYTN